MIYCNLRFQSVQFPRVCSVPSESAASPMYIRTAYAARGNIEVGGSWDAAPRMPQGHANSVLAIIRFVRNLPTEGFTVVHKDLYSDTSDKDVAFTGCILSTCAQLCSYC